MAYSKAEQFLIVNFDKYNRLDDVFKHSENVENGLCLSAERDRLAALIVAAENSSLICCQIKLEFLSLTHGEWPDWQLEMIDGVLRQVAEFNELAAER